MSGSGHTNTKTEDKAVASPLNDVHYHLSYAVNSCPMATTPAGHLITTTIGVDLCLAASCGVSIG